MTWLSFYEAVKEIEIKFHVSPGKAQSFLRQICATGEVRSQKQPYVIVHQEAEGQAPPQRIEPSEWRQREIDLMTDEDGCKYFVDVDKADFRYWLNQQGGKPKQGKQPLVVKYLAEMFPGRKVPDPAEYQRKDLLAELRERHPLLKSLNIKTLGRAIHRYNLSVPTDGKR
jgi:hypothetical protein